MRVWLVFVSGVLGCNQATGLDGGGGEHPALCAAGPGKTELARGSFRVPVIAVDDNEVFFVDEIGDTAALRKLAKKGGATTTLAQGFDVGGLLVLFGDDVYWALGQRITHVAKMGGAAQVIVDESPGVIDFVAGSDSLYYVEARQLLRMYPDGSRTMLAGGDGRSLLRVGVDGENAYWLDCLSSSANCTVGVRRVSIDGGTPGDLTSYQGSSSTALHVDDTSVYWVVNDFDERGIANNAIMRMPKSGGMPQTLGVSDGMVTALVGDERNLYFIATDNRGGGSLRRMLKAGGTWKDLAPATSALAIDDGCVYFANGVSVEALAK